MIVAIENPAIFLGLSLDDARMKVAGYGYHVRILSIDGKGFKFVSDYDPLRVNLRVVNNRVVDATIG